jgi:hypothetical protein
MKNKIGFGSRKTYVIKQLQILIQLAKIDHSYDQEEKSLIREFSNKFNIDPNILSEMERSSETVYDSMDDFSMDEKVELLYNAVHLAKVDKRIMPSEIIYCQEIASKLGFRRSAIQAMLPLVKDKPIEGVNYTMIRRKIAPYL